TVENPAALKGLSPGDRVRFEVERNGRDYVVTRLENSN
ncbi:MAG: copper-binding protein, partial [Reyranella sp.]